MNANPESLAPFLHNIADVQPADDGSLRLPRVPVTLLAGLNEAVRRRAYAPAGAELRFRQPRGPVTIRLRRMPDSNEAFHPPAAVLAGVFHGDFQSGWYALPEGDTTLAIPPFAGDRETLAKARYRYSPDLVRVVLPVFPEIRLVALEGELEPARAEDAPSRRYLAYGSSITHGAYTPLGTATYPAVVARLLGTDLLNLGFGNGARLEPDMARWIVSRKDWDFASLEMGINVLGDVAWFRELVKGFLPVFAADPAKRPVFCLDLLPCRGEIKGEDPAMFEGYRAAIRDELAALGVPHLHRLSYADGLARHADLADDLLHPGAHAFEDIGRHLAAQMRPVLAASGASKPGTNPVTGRSRARG
jgi:hypothetical protein